MRAFAALLALTSFASADQMFPNSMTSAGEDEFISMLDQLELESMIQNVPTTPKWSENFYFTVGEWHCTGGFGPMKFEIKNNQFYEGMMGKGWAREVHAHMLQDETQPDLLW